MPIPEIKLTPFFDGVFHCAAFSNAFLSNKVIAKRKKEQFSEGD